MAESEELRWLLEPPGEGQSHVYVAIGKGANLSPAVKDALDKLIVALRKTDEVQGFMMKSTGIVREPSVEDIYGFRDLSQPGTQTFAWRSSATQTGL